MEQQPPNPDESNESTPEKRRSLRRKLRHWLHEGPGLFKFGENRTPETATEEDDTPDIKKGRMTRFLEKFRRPFIGQIAQPEFLPVENHPTQEPSPVGRGGEAAAPTETAPPTPAEIVTLEPHTIEDAPEDRPASPPPPEVPPPVIMPSPEGGGAPSPAHIAAAEHLVAPFRSEATRSATRVERVIERPRGTGALAALLGLEYLGRRRADRKIRKDFTKKLTDERKGTRTELHSVSHQAKTTEQALYNVKDQQRAFEKQLAAAERTRKKTPKPEEIKVPELKTEPRPNQRPPEIKISKPEAQPSAPLPNAEQIVKQAEALKVLKQPEAVLKKVGQAAEQNIPVEAVYERRHEVKQSEAFAGGGGGNGGPGQANEPILLANVLRNRMSSRDELAKGDLAMSSSQPSEDLYKDAVKGGLWGAVALLIFIGILFLIAR